MPNYLWMDVGVLSSVFLNVILTILVAWLWLRDQRIGRRQYVVRDTGGILYEIYQTDAPDFPFYVGRTRNLERRIREHTRRSKMDTPLYLYWRNLEKDRKTVAFRVVDSADNGRELARKERERIAAYREKGVFLANVANGG